MGILMTFKKSKEYLKTFCSNPRINNILLVCGKSWRNMDLNSYLLELEKSGLITLNYYDDFHPNPSYESVVKGVNAFHFGGCDSIIAAGGGSAIDVGKCIKLFTNMDSPKDFDDNYNYLKQPVVENDVPFLAIPTTAGTGSEATHFAVIYYKGEKQSIAHQSILPSHVILYPHVLNGISEYQRKVTMLDTLCHAIESYWSVSATIESKKYASDAIETLISNIPEYLGNKNNGNGKMLMASHFAGKAINISKTTAAHAMSYKMTTLYDIAHGHAVALCLPKVWRYMLEDLARQDAISENDDLLCTFYKISKLLKCNTPENAILMIEHLLEELNINAPVASESDITILCESVNLERLSNNPIAFDDSELRDIYCNVLKTK